MLSKIKRIMDVGRAIDHVFTVLKYSGHYPLNNERNPSILYFILFYIIYAPMFAVQAVQLCIVFGDVDKMVEVAFLFVTHFGIFYKSYNMFAKSSVIYSITQGLYEDMHRYKNIRQEEIANMAKKRFGQFLFFYTLFAFFACSLILVAPVVHKMRVVPIGGWYPFDETRIGLYELAYMQQVSAVYVISLVTIALDSVFITLMVQLCVQLDFLKDEILSIGEEATRTTQTINGQKDCSKAFRELIAKAIVHHQDIIR